jgi:hypothetical protein
MLESLYDYRHCKRFNAIDPGHRAGSKVGDDAAEENLGSGRVKVKRYLLSAIANASGVNTQMLETGGKPIVAKWRYRYSCGSTLDLTRHSASDPRHRPVN